MGAYSSWAMLALTHHFCVQLAASRVYGIWGPWFALYALLGDDIVIADKAVAKEYLAIMKTLGVTIQETKSLVSNNGTFEFAKRTVLRGTDATPVSLKGLQVGLTNISCLEAALAKIPGIWSNKISSIARALGYGYKTLGRLQSVMTHRSRLQGLFVFLTRPGGLLGYSQFSDWISQDSPIVPGAPMSEDSMVKVYQSIGEWATDSVMGQVKRRLESFSRASGKGWLPTSLFPTRTLFDLYKKLVLDHVGKDLELKMAELEVLLLRFKGHTELDLDRFNELMKELDLILSELSSLPNDARVARMVLVDRPPTMKILPLWRRLRRLVSKD
jgi:hypothetical protein